MDHRDFPADEGGEFRNIRNPKLDQMAVRPCHRPELLYLREGGQINGATLKRVLQPPFKNGMQQHGRKKE